MTVLQRKLMKNRQRQKDLREQEEDLVIMLQDNCDHSTTKGYGGPGHAEAGWRGAQCIFCGWVDLNDGAGFRRP